MSILNRLLALCFLLVLLGVSLLTVVLATGWLSATAAYNALPYQPVLAIARDANTTAPSVFWYVVGSGAAAALLAVIGILAELRPRARRERRIALPATGVGYTELDYASLDHLAEYCALRVDGIKHARARVTKNDRGLCVRCRAIVSPLAEIPAAAQSVGTSIEEHLAHSTGLPVERVRVRINVQNLRGSRRVR